MSSQSPTDELILCRQRWIRQRCLQSRRLQSRSAWAGLVGCLALLSACGEPAPQTTSSFQSNTISTQSKSQGTKTEAEIAEPETSPLPTSEVVGPAIDQSTSQVDLRLLRRVSVRIEESKEGSVGCGVIVRSDQAGFDVLTADHLLNAGASYAIVLTIEIDGQLVERLYKTTDIVLRDPACDLACLRVESQDHDKNATAELGATSVTQNAMRRFDAWIMRAPAKKPLVPEQMTVAESLPAKRTASDRPVTYWRMASSIDAGMSGGPLFSQQGKLLGIASGNSAGSGYYVGVAELRAFISRL